MEKLGATHQNLDQKVYEMLKSMIMDRRIAPGTRILQDKLAMFKTLRIESKLKKPCR